MSLFHYLRKIANKGLGPLGFELSRLKRRKPLYGNPIFDVLVGRFYVRIPSINTLNDSYGLHPDYGSHLGRVTSLVKKKYALAGAIDIGANIGDTASIIKSAEDIPIICVEGDPYCFGFLQENLKQFKEVSAHQMFMGEKSGRVKVELEKSGWNMTLKPAQTEAAREIEIVSLDDFLADRSDVETLKILKIDTEGFDCPILRGGLDFIKKVRPVISFEYNRENMKNIGEKGLDTLSLLKDLGYSSLILHDCVGRFLSPAQLSDWAFIEDIHGYADGGKSLVYYFDMTLFHESDSDLAGEFARTERSRRDRLDAE